MPCVLARPQCIMFPSTYNNSPLLPAGAVALLGLAFGLPRHIMPPLPLDCPSCFSLPPCPPCRFCGASRACRRPATPSFRCWGDRQPCSSRSHTSCWSLSRCGAGGGGARGGVTGALFIAQSHITLVTQQVRMGGGEGRGSLICFGTGPLAEVKPGDICIHSTMPRIAPPADLLIHSLPLPPQGVQRTVCVGSGAVAAAAPPARLVFDPHFEPPHLTAAKAARKHARDIHPEVRVRGSTEGAGGITGKDRRERQEGMRKEDVKRDSGLRRMYAAVYFLKA